MGRFQKPAEGSWTEHYPELGTGPVSFADSISPEFYQLEREAIFKRAWLYVGRVEFLSRDGSYFTVNLPGLGTSVILSRDREGRLHAFHNVCRHRGNKLLWEGTPRDETSGNARQFVCKYHGWRYGLDGACTYVHQEKEFFGLRKDEIGLAPIHCETWAGFIFVNLAPEPDQTLRDYLGPMVGALEGYPFDRMTERYSFRAENNSNWKVFIDAFQEYYHVPPLHTHQLGPTPEAQNPEYEFEAAHYQLDGPHRMVSTSGTHKHGWPAEHLYPAEALTRSGSTGPWDAPELGGTLHGVNPSGISRWGIDNFQVFPNLEILIYERGWFVTYPMPRLTKFEEYRDRYPDFALEKTADGILLVQMHRDGGPAVWDERTHHDIANLFNDIGGDRDVLVVIYTGTGETFNANWGQESERPFFKAPAEWAEEMAWYGRLRHINMLEIDAIMIAAVNGPSNIHSELALMCDIVLASDDTYFQDLAHFPRNLSPGDGIQNIWPLVLGRNRFRYAQLMAQKITAQMAHEWGAVNEVLPKAALMDRAWEIARYLLRYSPIVLRHTRRTFVQEFKRAAVNDLGYGQTMEILGMTQFTPYGGGMKPLDRAWNDPDLWKKR